MRSKNAIFIRIYWELSQNERFLLCGKLNLKPQREIHEKMWKCDTRRYRLVRDYQFLSIYWLARKERLRLDGIREFLERQCEVDQELQWRFIRFDSNGLMYVNRRLIPLLQRNVEPTRKRRRKRAPKPKTTGTKRSQAREKPYH